MSSLVLMENAGRGVTDVLCQQGIAGPVLICCGKGNNAGDGLVVARHLDLRGHQVNVACWSDPTTWSGDTAANYQIAAHAKIPIRRYEPSELAAFRQQVAVADWVIDALLGTGTHGAPRSPLDQVIRDMNDFKTGRVLAVDLPSGLDADTGQPSEPTVRADVTCTFVAEKTGFASATALPFLGQVFVLDIGVPRILLRDVV
jgi:NAD(P)H-hydrate epimerase